MIRNSGDEKVFLSKTVWFDNNMVSYWIFQANPKRYDLDRAMKNKDIYGWNIKEKQIPKTSKVKKGDIAVMWKSGHNAGIVGWGRILTDPAIIPEDIGQKKYYMNGTIPTDFFGVKISVEHYFPKTILRRELKKDDRLKNMIIIRSPQRTIARIRPEEAKILREEFGIGHEVIEQEDYYVPDNIGESKIRKKQELFRRVILQNYDNKCCICDVNVSELLVGSHIKPWNKDKENRLNPSNGLCLCVFHDKCFDLGLITISENYEIIVSESLKQSNSKFIIDNIIKYEGKTIRLPSDNPPGKEFIKYHQKEIFRGKLR